MLEIYEYLLLLLINWLVCIGFFVSCSYDEVVDVDFITKLKTNRPVSKMALWWLRYYGRKISPTLMMSISDCLICMASIHSIYVFWPLHSWSFFNLGLWVVYVLALAGLNTIAFFNMRIR